MNKVQVENHAKSFSYSVARFINTTFYDDFLLTTIKLDWSPKRRSSRGGIYAKGPGINMAMAHYRPITQGVVNRFYEYSSFDANNVIGGFYHKEPLMHLEAVLTHEIAHAVQFFSYSKTGTKCKPHGPVFKRFYAALREEFVNPKLPNQKLLKQEYDERLKRLLGNNHG